MLTRIPKLHSCQPGLPVDAAQKLDRMIRAHMKDLKATKVAGPHPISDGCGHEYHLLVCGYCIAQYCEPGLPARG
jgi:hypothetical protein